MSFNWREFLIVAHWLRDDPREGVQRTCLGRAYYYVYNLGLARASTLNFHKPPRSVHKKLWGWCQKQTDPTIKQMGVIGGRMHALRIQADYQDTLTQNLALAVREQLERAREFERLVAESKGQAPPAALAP